MGRLLRSPNPGRLLVLTAGAFTLVHLAGLLAWSGFSEGGGISPVALGQSAALCVAWVFIALMFLDRAGRGKSLLTRLLARGRLVEGVGLALLFSSWLVVALVMTPWNDEISNLKAAQYLFQNGFAAYFADYARINDWLGPHHPPLLQLIYAGIYFLFGGQIIFGRIFALLCSVLACALGYVWIKRQAGRSIALVAAGLCMSFPLVAFNGASSILDAPFWLIFTASLLLFDRYCVSGRLRDAAFCALAVGVALLSRYNGFLLPPIFLVLLLRSPERGGVFRRPGTWLILGGPFLVLLPWFCYAALTGSLFVQLQKLASFVLVVAIPEGGAVYIKQILAPLLPFMVGLWNIPLWFGGILLLWQKDRDEGSRRIVLIGLLYMGFMLASLPNPRYLLAIAPALCVPLARQVLEVEEREGRGAELLVFCLGLSLLHIVLVLHQTALGAVYLFY